MQLTHAVPLLLLLVVSASACCSPQQTRDTNINPTANDVEATNTPSHSTRLVPVGHYSNFDDYGEHENGFAVELWQNGDRLAGLISGGGSLRLVSDQPVGLLEDVSFDKESGRLVFTSSISHLFDLELGTERRELRKFVFDGFLKPESIEGLITVKDNKTRRISIKLLLSNQWTKKMDSYENIDELMKSYRVPKWDIPK